MIWGLFVFLMLLQVMDIVTTNYVIDNGGRESNPIVEQIMDTFGPFWWIPKIVVSACGGGFLVWFQSMIGLVILCCIYVLVCAVNIRNIVRLVKLRQ